MNEFRFLAPDGRYGTVSAENFSAAYSAGGIPVEAMPEIDVMSPDGTLSTLRHEKASELIKTQGFKLATQPRPLRFASPDGRTGTVKVGLESAALGQGGTLLLEELDVSKPLKTDLPRDPKIAAEPPESALGNWFGPAPKDPATLKGWDSYQALVAKNKKGKAGFWEGITPNMTNVPFLGTALAAVDAGKAALTAQRLKEGKPASDQDVLDLNMFIAKQEREANATMLGKAGNVVIDMTTFMAEIGGSIKAFIATLPVGGAGGVTALGSVLASKAAAKAGVKSVGKLSVGMARKMLKESGEEWAQNLVAKKVAAEASETVAEYLTKHGGRRIAAKLLGQLPEIGVATIAPTIGQIVPQLAATQLAGQDAGTYRGNVDKAFAALMGEDMENSAAIWRSVADTTIENWSEAMGETILAGMSKIPIVGGLGQAIRRNAGAFVEKLGKAGTAEGFQAVDRIAGMTALSKWLYGRAKKGGSFRMMMEDLHAVGYDGVFGEMMEERAGDWMRGLFGLEGDADENAVKRAFKNSLPDPEQLGVELIAFSIPALAVGGLRFAAVSPNMDEYFRRREALDGLATLHKNRKPWVDGSFTSGDGEASKPIVKDIVREHEAYQRDSTGWLEHFNSAFDGLLSMKIVDGKLEVDPDVKYKNVMSVMIGTTGGMARTAYLENLGRKPTEEDLDKALDVGAEHAMRQMARQGGFIWLYDSTLRTTDGAPSAEAGATTEQEAFKYMSKTQLQALRDANLLTIDEFGRVFMLDPRSYDTDQHELLAHAFELGTARQVLEDKKSSEKAREEARKQEADALEKIGKIAPGVGPLSAAGAHRRAAEAVARLMTLTPAEARDVALQQNIRFEGALDLDQPADETALAEAKAKGEHALLFELYRKHQRFNAYVNQELDADPLPGSLNDLLLRATVSPDSMSPEEKVRAASFLTGYPDAARLDEATSVARRVHKMIQEGEIAFQGDKIVRSGDGQKFVVLSPFRDEKTRKSMYRVAPMSETGTPLASEATFISAEDLKAKYRNETKTGVAISKFSRVQGSLKSMVPFLHRAGYLGSWVRSNRRDGESVEQTLARMTSRDLTGLGLVKAMKGASGKELFYYDIGARSLFLAPLGKRARGVAYNPMQMADMAGAHFSEDFTEVTMLQLAADALGQNQTADRLRAALPVLAAAVSRAQKEAEHVLVQAAKNSKTSSERAKAAEDLATLRKLPSVDSSDVLNVVEAMSKTVKHYVHGYKDFPDLRRLVLGDAVEALYDNSSLSHDLPAIRAELETVASKEYWDSLRYDGALDSADSAPPAAGEVGKTGDKPPSPPADGGEEAGAPPAEDGPAGPSVPADSLLDDAPPSAPPPAPAPAKKAETPPAPKVEAPAKKAETPPAPKVEAPAVAEAPAPAPAPAPAQAPAPAPVDVSFVDYMDYKYTAKPLAEKLGVDVGRPEAEVRSELKRIIAEGIARARTIESETDPASKQVSANGKTVTLKPMRWKSRFGAADKSGKPIVYERGGVSDVLSMADRMMVVLDINGVNIPFYLSTGHGGKKDVTSGKWYPFFGVDANEGWINKTSGAEINNYYGSPALREAAEALDAIYGDMRAATGIPAISGKSPLPMSVINRDMFPAENGKPDTTAKIRANIDQALAKIAVPASAVSAPAPAPVAEQAENAGGAEEMDAFELDISERLEAVADEISDEAKITFPGHLSEEQLAGWDWVLDYYNDWTTEVMFESSGVSGSIDGLREQVRKSTMPEAHKTAWLETAAQAQALQDKIEAAQEPILAELAAYKAKRAAAAAAPVAEQQAAAVPPAPAVAEQAEQPAAKREAVDFETLSAQEANDALFGESAAVPRPDPTPEAAPESIKLSGDADPDARALDPDLVKNPDALADRLVRFRPGMVRRIGALKTIGKDLMGSGLLSPQAANDMLLGYMASSLRLSKPEAFDVLLALRWNPGAKALAETAPTEAEMEAELTGSLAEALGLSSDAEVPMSSDKLAGSGNADMMDSKLKEVTDVVRVVLDAAMGYAPVAEIGRAIRKSAPGGKPLGTRNLPAWLMSKEAFGEWAAERKANMRRYSDNFAEQRLARPLDAAETMFNSVVASLPWEHALQIYKAAQNTFPREVREVRPNDGYGTYFEALLPPDEAGVQHDAVRGATIAEVEQNVAALIKMNMYRGQVSAEELAELVHETGNGSAMATLNDAAPRMAAEQAAQLRRRLMPEEYFGDANAELRAAVERAAAMIDSKRGTLGRTGAFYIDQGGNTVSRFGYLVNEGVDTKSEWHSPWKKQLADDFLEVISRLLTGAPSPALVAQLEKDLLLNKGLAVRKSLQNLWEQMIEPLAALERERTSSSGAEAQRRTLAARGLNALMEGTAESPGVFYKALGLAYGGSELEAFAYMRDRKNFFQTNDKYLSKLLGQFAVRNVVTPVGRATGGKAFSGYRARSPQAEAAERLADRRGDLRPAVLVSEAAGMDSVEGSEMSSAQMYDTLRGVARGAFARLRKGEPGEVFLPMTLSGDKLELNGVVWTINGETRILGDKRFEGYGEKDFDAFFNDIYFGSDGRAGAHERFTVDMINEIAPGVLDPGGQFSLYRKAKDGKLERKSPAEIGKIIQDVLKRFSQIGTPIVDGVFGPPGYLQTAEDGAVEYVVALKADGTPYKGPGDGLLWVMPWLRDAARKTYGGAEKQASYKLGNWGPTDRGVLSQTKGAVAMDPNRFERLDQSEPGALTPAELEDVLADDSFRRQLPNAVFLATGNAQKMGPGKFDRIVEVVRGSKTYKFGVFRAAPLGVTSTMPTDTALQERWVGMQPVAGGAGILNVPGGTLDARADYYRVFMDELYSGADSRIRKALERPDAALFEGDNRRPMLNALAKEGGWLGGSLAAMQTLFARLRGAVNAAKKKGHAKLVSPIQSTGAAREDGTLAPATDGPLEYDESARLHPSGGQVVRGMAKPSSLSDHRRLANGGLTMPGMGLGLEDIGEADLKRAAKHYEKLFGRRNIPANEKELGAAAHELMTELAGMAPGTSDFTKTRAILRALLAPVRARSEFIPLDGSTVFGRSLDDARKVVAHLQAKHHLLYDLARIRLEGGKGQFDVEYEHSSLSKYTGEGVNLDDFVVHSSEDGQAVIGFRIPGIPLLVHRSPALGHLQSMRVIRLTELTKDAAAIFYHQDTLTKEGADEDGDQSHVFPLPPMSLLALHKSFEFLRDNEFEVGANARPDRFSDAYPEELRDSWLSSLVPENLERITDPRVMALSRDANLAGSTAISTAASILTAAELMFADMVLERGIPGLRDAAAADPYVAVRFAVLHDMVNRIVDGGKVPHQMKGMMLYQQFVPVFVAAAVGSEVPFVEGLEGQALYDHVHRHTVQDVTEWLSQAPKGRRVADNVLVGGMTLGKAFRATYGKKAKEMQPKIAALLALSDDMTTLSTVVRSIHKFKPTSFGDMVSLLEKIDSVLAGRLKTLPALANIPANRPLRVVLDSIVAPFRPVLEELIGRVEQDVLVHPTGALDAARAEQLLANPRTKALVWKRRGMDGESYDYGWTAAGLSKLWDMQLDLHQRLATATLRARELATRAEFADMPAAELAEEGLRGTVDPGVAPQYHVFDSVVRRRAELRATPEFADNVVLSALELSVTMPEAVGEAQERASKQDRSPRIRVGAADSFSVPDARRDWAKLPPALQIDIFDLIARFNGLHRSESRLYDLVPPAFMKEVFALERQIAEGFRNGSIDIDAARPLKSGITLRGMLDFARESYLSGAAGATVEAPAGKRIPYDGAGSYLRFAPFVKGWEAAPYYGAPAIPELLGENAGEVGLPAPSPARPAPAPAPAPKSVKDVAVEAKAPDKYRTKELAKAAASNKVAAIVDANVEDASYAKRLGLAAQAAGHLVTDAARVKEGDVVYVSMPGRGRGANVSQINGFIDSVVEMVEAGAAVITDNEANAKRMHNVGAEGVLRERLLKEGFQETENKKFGYSLWRKGAIESPAAAVAEAQAPAVAQAQPEGQVEGQSIAAIREVLRTENTMPIEWAKLSVNAKRFGMSDERVRQADEYRRSMVGDRLVDPNDAARRAAIGELESLAADVGARDATKAKLEALVAALRAADAAPEAAPAAPQQLELPFEGQSASLDNPPEVQTEAWRMAVAYPKTGAAKESFFTREGDPNSDLGDPESAANRTRRTILPEELSEAPLPADVEAALDDAMGLVNVPFYRRPLPDGSGAPAAVFRDGVVFAESPNAVGPAIAALAVGTVGENLPALNAILDPAIAQALTPTERSKYAGRRASTSVEAEIVLRLAGSSSSLFSTPHVWPAALAADMADMLIHHPAELLKHSRVAMVDGAPQLVSMDAGRELASADRSLSPNDSAAWERVLESDRVPEKLRAKLSGLTSAHEAIEAVVEAVDAGRIKDPEYDRVERALVRSAAENLRVRPISGEPGEMARRELASGMSMGSIYYHDAGTRIAALQTVGIPGQHLAFYEMMNQHTASWNNGAHWLNTKASILPYETATLYRLFTDKEGYRREDSRTRTHLTMSQRQAEKRFEAAVTAIMEHSHKFDLSDPAKREALLDAPGTVVYGKNQAAYRRGSDERSGTLPESETIRQALSHFNSELRGLLLDPEKGGRTEAEIDPFLLAEDAKAQYEKDFRELNEAAFEFLDGREYLRFHEGYAGMHMYSYGQGAGMDPAGDQALADIFDHVKHADVELSFMKRPDGRADESLKTSHKTGIPAWTPLQQKVLGEQSPDRLRKAMRRDRVPNVVEANRMIVDALQENLYAAASEYHAKHGARAGTWKPGEGEKRQIATVKQLRDVLARFRFVESAPAEFARELETFAEAYKKRGLVPKSMSFLALRGEYIDRVHTAASHKAILNSYLLITNPDGSPSIMAKPAADVSLERGAISRDTWIKHGDAVARHFKDKFNRHAADVPVVDPETKKVLYVTPGVIAEIRRLYDAHADKDGQFTSTRMSSVEAWSASDKDAGRLVKMLVQVSPAEVYPWAAAVQRLLSWTKTMSFGWSFFFQTALGESSIGMSGPFKGNLALTFLTRPFLKSSRADWAKFWGHVRAFREHRRYYNPTVARDLDYILRMGLTTGRAAALEPYADVFRKDVHKIGAGLKEKYGDRIARFWTTFWFGADKTDQGWARFWPGVTGRKMSDWMFSWFSAVKEAQMDLAVKKLALEHGLSHDGGASWSQARFLAKYFDDGMGGQNWYRYLWATPSWMFGLNLGLLAPNWTLSSWNTSGLAPITQALFKNYPAPGQQRFIWTHYMPSMLLWTMTVIPSMLQAAAYMAGLAGGGDDDDVPLPIMNEPGRKQHIDVTPLMRLLPWYKGDPTGKRRMYLQFGKQVHETGLSNPLGTRGWINEPWDQLMRKLPMPVRALYEQLTGASPGSDWQLEFNGKGMLGVFNSGEPGLKGFMTSRLGYIAQKLIPMSVSQFLQNPEVLPLNHFAPTSKGASQSKTVKNVASVLATYASAKDWHRIRQVPRARAALDSLVPEFLRAAEANGYNADKVLATAKGMVLGDLYDRMWKALDAMDEPLMRETAASIWRVGGALKGLRSSMANKQRSFGIELTPEQMQAAESAMQWAMYGSE